MFHMQTSTVVTVFYRFTVFAPSAQFPSEHVPVYSLQDQNFKMLKIIWVVIFVFIKLLDPRSRIQPSEF